MKSRVLIMLLIASLIVTVFAMAGCSKSIFCIGHEWEAYQIVDGNVQTEVCVHCNVTRRLCYPFEHTWTSHIDNGDGTHTSHCSACDVTVVEKHSLSNVAPAKKNGVVKCDYCGATYTENNSVVGPEFNDPIPEGPKHNCAEAGHIDDEYWPDFRCDVIGCGASLCEEHVIDPHAKLTHNSDYTEHGYLCLNCNDFIYVENCDTSTYDPEEQTCATHGRHIIYCSNAEADGHVDLLEVIYPATGEHTDADEDGYCDDCFGDISCTHKNMYLEENLTNSMSYHWYICPDCGMYGEPIEHRFANVELPATCWKGVISVQECADCGYTKDRKEISEKAEHLDEDGDNRCDSCSSLFDCGEYHEITDYFYDDTHHWEGCYDCCQKWDIHEHELSEPYYVEASCTGMGYLVRKCSCGYSVKTAYTNQLEHDYSNDSYLCHVCLTSKCLEQNIPHEDEDGDWLCDNCYNLI